MGTAESRERSEASGRLSRTEPHQRKLRVFGRKKGRPLRARKSSLVAELLPRLQIALLPHALPGKYFDKNYKDYWLEIGFGSGDHFVAQAQNNPHIGLIGCEPFLNGIAATLDLIDRAQIGNVRIFPDDARKILDALPDQSIARCFILFPDPWPKKRHAVRRFICPDNLARLARVMKHGAELRLASDDPVMQGWMQEQMNADKNFKCAASWTDGARPDEKDWAISRYEKKARVAKRVPFFWIWKRR